MLNFRCQYSAYVASLHIDRLSALVNHAVLPQATAPRYRCASVGQIPPARPPPPVTSALVASVEANPTGARRRHLHPCRLRQTKSHRRTDDPPPALGRPRRWLHPQKQPHRRADDPSPGAKSHWRTDDRASLSLRLCRPNPTGTPVTSALVASAEANPTSARRRHLRLRQSKSHRRG